MTSQQQLEYWFDMLDYDATMGVVYSKPPSSLPRGHFWQRNTRLVFIIKGLESFGRVDDSSTNNKGLRYWRRTGSGDSVGRRIGDTPQSTIEELAHQARLKRARAETNIEDSQQMRRRSDTAKTSVARGAVHVYIGSRRGGIR